MDFIKIGKVISTHGLDGRIRVKSDVMSLENFQKLEFLPLGRVSEIEKSIKISDVVSYKNDFLIRSPNINGVDEAATLKGMLLLYPAKMLHRLDPETFYFFGIQGSKVYDENRCYVGVLSDYTPAGSYDVFHIQLATSYLSKSQGEASKTVNETLIEDSNVKNLNKQTVSNNVDEETLSGKYALISSNPGHVPSINEKNMEITINSHGLTFD